MKNQPFSYMRYFRSESRCKITTLNYFLIVREELKCYGDNPSYEMMKQVALEEAMDLFDRLPSRIKNVVLLGLALDDIIN